jgi:hypothetical protein
MSTTAQLAKVAKLEDQIPPGPNAPPKKQGGYKSKLEHHPIAAVFPMLAEPEILTIATSILKNGLRDDITLYEGKILDGRNRDRACEIAGVEPKFTEFRPELDGSPVTFVWDKNGPGRRHLSPGQKAMAAQAMIPFFEAEAAKHAPPNGSKETSVDASGDYSQENRRGGRKASGGKAAAKAAATTGASRSSVEKARKLAKKNPEAAGKVTRGETTLNKAAMEEDLKGAYKRIEEICGKSLAEAARTGKRFRNKRDVIRFAKLPAERMRDIQGLIETANWSVADALQYKAKDLNSTHKIGDLLARCAQEGGAYTCEVDGYMVNCSRKKAVAKKKKVAASTAKKKRH